MKAIKGFIARHQFTEVFDGKASEGTEMKPVTPLVSALDDELFKTSLSAALMKSAESTQPWSTVGVDQWIESGRWWLLRSQMELYAVTVPQQKVPLAAYTNLIKASWILVDIIACHPQVPYIKASTHSEVQLLSAELKNEFSRLSALQSTVPDLSKLEGQDLRIWETQARGPLLRPHKDSRRLDEWTVDGGEQVLFQRFALCKLRILTEALPCILLFLVRGNGQCARLVTQNQNGAIIMAVSFQTPVETLEYESSVEVNAERITFNTVQDARHFGCLVEATNFYCCGRKADHASLEDLKAYVLITAVKNRKKDVIEQLLQRISPKDGALQNESFVVASMLAKQRLANQLIDTWESDSEDISLFCWAIQCGLAPLVKVLLTELPTTHGKDWDEMTPLGLASFCGHESVVRLLVGSGTDVQARDSSRRTALHHACSRGQERAAMLLLESAEERRNADTSKSSVLSSAECKGRENIVQLLIDSGADIEAQDFEGFTPLCKATSLHHEAVIALLISKGANVNQRNEHDMNATHFALESPMTESTVRAILAKQLGGRVNVQNEAGLRSKKVVLNVKGSKWTKFYLDSPNAIIHMPKDIPSNFECAYDRMISITRPSGTDQTSRFEFQFMIFHSENKLDFSLGYGDLDAPELGTWFDIKIGNWWQKRVFSKSGLTVFTGVVAW